jgi:hypothetical protein
MLGALKKTVQNTAGMAGLQIKKVKREPFQELWNVPRLACVQRGQQLTLTIGANTYLSVIGGPGPLDILMAT